MALETFGTEVAKMINHAALLCHDLIKDHHGSSPIDFTSGQKGVWKVEVGEMDGVPCVVIKLGVG